MEVAPSALHLQPGLVEQGLPLAERPHLLPDIGLARAGEQAQSPGQEVGVRHQEQEDRLPPGHAHHLPQGPDGAHEMLQRAEAGHYVEPAIRKRQGLRRRHVELSLRESRAAGGDGTRGDVHAADGRAAFVAGQQPLADAARHIQHLLPGPNPDPAG